MSLSTGTRLGHYEILAPIGAGSMGQVYRACDLRLNREVAIKVLPPGAGSDLERQARFAKEAQAAASIKHPNVAVIYDSDRCDGVTYIAMELVEGEQLSDVLARGQPTPDRALAIALAVARGLAAAHERGVLHRDLKPANIVLTPEGFPKIVDFGLAKVMTEPSDLPRDLPTVTSNDTRAGVILGTANYMSPEQARGQRVDARSDMFSFGIVLHELLTGSRPFIGPSAPEVLAAIISKPHPRLPLLAGRATVTDLQRIVDRCLEKSPAARYPTMIGVVGDLENACRPAAAISRSSRSMWLLAAAVLLAMAALFGWWTLRTGRDETQWVLESGLPELERLVAADAYAEAFALAARIDRARPDDATLRELWPKLAQVLTVSTTPDGAEVRFRSVSAADGPWESLGVSPLVERRVPIGFFWLRVEKAGFDTFEALIGGQGVYIDPSRPRTIAIELEPVGGQPSRSVHVPGGRTAINLGRLDVVDPVQLPPFRIDRFEVTNREYKTFLESGAYRDPARWHHEFRDGGRHLTFDEAVSRLVDQTGRPGPSTWEVGTFADGNTDQPVSGVSWYEAAAYCESVGKALPTIFHWSAAALPGSTAVAVVPGSNFGERGLRPVGSGRPGLHGAYDMAGNAKEWTWNDAGGTRYILGGAWNEPGYQFHQPDAQAPLTRRAGFGFRCAEYSDVMPEVMVAARRAVPLPAPMASRDPIPDDVFRAYKALFAFDRVPMDARLLERDTSNPAWSREKVAFRAPYSAEDIFVYLFLPVGVRPPLQPVVYFPGTTAQRQRSPEELQTRMIDFLVQSGRAVVYPIYTGTHERRLDAIPKDDTRAGVDYTARLVGDLQRTVDYLETRSDVRMDALTFYGFSWGAELGPLMLALDTRFRAAVLLDGGLAAGSLRPEITPAGYAPRVRIPILMVNGSYDATYQLESSQKPLFALLGSSAENKLHVRYPTGHAVFTLYRNQAIHNILDWLDRYLGPTS